MDIIEIIEKLGLPVAMVVVFIWINRAADKRHSNERTSWLNQYNEAQKEWREDTKEYRKTHNELQGQTNTVLRELTEAIRKDNDNQKQE